MAGSNKRPRYYNEAQESAFFARTPKHVLYALARDYALQVNEDSGDVEVDMARHLEEMAERIDTIKANGLLP